MGPERVLWYAGAPPPAGQYDVCFKAVSHLPEPSSLYPLSYTVTVRRIGQPDLVIWRFAFSPSSGTSCTPDDPTYVTSFMFPAGP